MMGGVDLYVKIKFFEDKILFKKIIVKYKNLNFEWNEEYKFLVRDFQIQVFEFSVYDWEQVNKLFLVG